jgi:hypothetical protein
VSSQDTSAGAYQQKASETFEVIFVSETLLLDRLNESIKPGRKSLSESMCSTRPLYLRPEYGTAWTLLALGFVQERQKHGSVE